MSSTLSEGVRVPDIGSTSWGADVNYNWGLLNTALANISGNVKTNVENTWTAPQTFTETISGSIDGVAARAVGDEDGNNIKTALAGKQPSLSQSQLDACNSGITASAVQQIGTNADNISGLQTAVASKAADNAVVHLAGAETIPGDKTFTGATATHNITPETDGTYSLGSSTYRWLNVYSTNSYYINRSILTFGTPPSNSDCFGYRYNDNTGAVFGDLLFCAHKDGHNYLRMRCRNTNGTDTYDRQVQLLVKQDGTTQFIPNNSGVTELGTSGNSWKTLNGINPGALGMIDTSTYVDIDTSGWVTTGATNRVYINGANPTFPGYLFIRAAGTAADYIAVRIGGTATTLPVWTSPYDPAGGGLHHVVVPCPANSAIRVYTSVAPAVCRYYACLGNV